jgi:hypothetical protein
MNEVMHHIGNGVIVREHTEEIEHTMMLAVDMPFFTLDDIERLKRDRDFAATMFVMRHVFRGEPTLFSKHPGDVQPTPELFQDIIVDGEPISAYVVYVWRCTECRRKFIVSAKSQLIHGPCFEGEAS